ncbi:unnamed protein product [Urochloa humidicola]
MASSAPLAQEELQPAGKHLRNQLAAAARSINWSYAIFWSISSGNPGALTWKDGFYNGEIKTRRINNSSLELSSNQVIMQRSEQLRELYEALLSAERNRRVARPVASLSPEDLGDTEWYYVVCMTYAFRPGQGLPGISFASNEHVWLWNTHLANSRTFSRALLAKTIFCVPLLGGVLELGTTSSVPENTHLVDRITRFFKETPQFPNCMNNPSANLIEQANSAIVLLDDLDEDAMETMVAEGRHELGEVDCLFNTNVEQLTEIDDLHGLWEELDVQPLGNSWIMDGPFLSVVPEAKATATQTQSVLGDGSRVTSFMAWTMPRSDELATVLPVIGKPQMLLKKVVSGGAWTNNGDERTGIKRTTQESDIKNHAVSERRRREKLNEMFLILESLVPTIRRVDKASILAETIAYLKELEQKVQELESSMGPVSRPADETMQRCHDNEIPGKRICAAKRKKASQVSGNMEGENHWVLNKDSASKIINVSVNGAEVVVQVQCWWNELLMARVFDAIKHLHLDILWVQASTPDGLLRLKIQAQFVSSTTLAPGMIREALQKAISMS